MIHKVNDQIRHNHKNWNCICADKNTAVFAPVRRSKDHLRTIYKDMIAVPNHKSHIGEFDYEKVVLKPKGSGKDNTTAD